MTVQQADGFLMMRLPHLEAYLSRVGAERRSFKRFVIEGDPVYGSLRRVICEISIMAGRSLTWSNEDFAPTPAELANIERELAGYENWPRSIPIAKEARYLLLREISDDRPELYYFYDRSGENILFAQQRVRRPDGTKVDLPWTYWSDGVWRRMEPDGLLPLFGLDQLAGNLLIMVHEGAKTASAVKDLCLMGSTDEHLSAHPWTSKLRDYAHLGWPGGATNAHRVDWTPLQRLSGDYDIVLVCDNDQVGKAAASQISKALSRPLVVLMFDERFPLAFDLADPFPQSLFKLAGGLQRYVGPSLEDCCRPGTWATRLNSTGRGRSNASLTKDFVAENVFVNTPPLYVNRLTLHTPHSAETFNRTVRPFSDVADTASLLLRHPEAQVAGVIYDPRLPSGVVVSEGSAKVNLYRPGKVRGRKGSIRPFLRFIRALIPDRGDRRVVLRWCATLIARPDIRMKFGILLISETQGVGKSTLMEKVLAPLVGWPNVSAPSEHDVSQSSFNGWIAKKRLVLIHEIYSGQSKKAYNNVKSWMTDEYITVNEKFVPTYEIRNWSHFMVASNSRRALHIAKEDRRWFVPKLTTKVLPPTYWHDLNEWLVLDGLEAIAYWAVEHVAKYGCYSAGDIAPASRAKRELVEESLSEGQRLVRDLAEAAVSNARSLGSEVALSDRDVRAWLANQLGVAISYPRLESLATIRAMLVEGGMAKLCDAKVVGIRSQIFGTSNNVPRNETTGKYVLTSPNFVMTCHHESTSSCHDAPVF